jgi:signal transduction histidine kinase
VVDITTRRDAARELHEKTAEIEEFAYRTSHDLRSPLKSIVGMMDCVTEDIEDGELEDAKAGVASVSFLTRKLLTLTGDLLTLTQIDSTTEDHEPFDFEDYLATAAVKFGAPLKQFKVALSAELHHAADLACQRARLTQVLDNLLSNGIKYSNPDQETRSVKLRTSTAPGMFVIEVEDNGTGIAASNHDSVFGMFKRFHGASNPGSGLGLYMVKKQAEQLGAEISFDSTPEGTTFRLTFHR